MLPLLIFPLGSCYSLCRHIDSIVTHMSPFVEDTNSNLQTLVRLATAPSPLPPPPPPPLLFSDVASITFIYVLMSIGVQVVIFLCLFTFYKPSRVLL